MTRRRVRAAARGLGTVCGLVAAGTWLWLWIDEPWGELGIAVPAAALVTAIFVGLALAGVAAAVQDVPIVLLLTGLFSLVPVGIYFLLAPGFLPIVGWSDVGLLASGIVLLAAGGGDEELSAPRPPER